MSSKPASRSSLKEFLASIATIKGDLSNITAPPFVLATQSTIEFPAYWAEHPSFLTAPSAEPDPAKRSLLVLRWFLASLKNQQYGGRSPSEGIKKPLNAFLGELFLASWEGADGETRLVAEQVSHHPPITACYLWNEQAGVQAEGYACQEISFSGHVNVKQFGHAILRIEKYDEDYLIPLPDVTVKGILGGSPYPELHGNYRILSSSGFVSEINFSGKGLLSGKRNSVNAAIYRDGDKKTPLYTVEGQWNGEFTFFECDGGNEIEKINVEQLGSTPMRVASLEQQDQWESRKAWGGVIAALNEGNMQKTSDEKSQVEEGQRTLRKEEESKGLKWEPVFFKNVTSHPTFDKLAKNSGEELEIEKTKGVWKFDHDKWEDGINPPYHGNLTPYTTIDFEIAGVTEIGAISQVKKIMKLIRLM